MLAVISILLILTTACGFSLSTANIKNANMARDVNGSLEEVEFYSQDEVFICTAELANAPDDTVVTAQWFAVEADGIEPNYLIKQASVTTGSDQVYFDLSNNILWPAGTYRVDLLVNDEIAESIEFQVE